MYIIVLFGHLPDGVFGESEIGNNRAIIKIDLKKGVNPARTYLHELIHIKYPGWTESKVRMTERLMWAKFDQERRFKVYRELFNRVYVPISGFEE